MFPYPFAFNNLPGHHEYSTINLNIQYYCVFTLCTVKHTNYSVIVYLYLLLNVPLYCNYSVYLHVPLYVSLILTLVCKYKVVP